MLRLIATLTHDRPTQSAIVRAGNAALVATLAHDWSAHLILRTQHIWGTENRQYSEFRRLCTRAHFSMATHNFTRNSGFVVLNGSLQEGSGRAQIDRNHGSHGNQRDTAGVR